MKHLFIFSLLLACFTAFSQSEGRTVISLNGQWDFDQTELAFPPKKYTRTIPVPGLVHLAKPRIEQYEKFFKKPTDADIQVKEYRFTNRDYTPMYSWYRRQVNIDQKLQGQQLFITLKKSQYVTMVYVNGLLVGRSIECYTPIEFNITEAV